MDGPTPFSPDRNVLCLFDVDGTLTRPREVSTAWKLIYNCVLHVTLLLSWNTVLCLHHIYIYMVTLNRVLKCPVLY